MSAGLGERLEEIRRRKTELEQRRKRLVDEPIEWDSELGPPDETILKDLLASRMSEISETDAQLAAVRSEEEAALLNFPALQESQQSWRRVSSKVFALTKSTTLY